MSAPAIVGSKASIDSMADGAGIASGTSGRSGAVGGTTHAVIAKQVAVLLGDASMRVLEAGLALGALATALILGMGR